MRHPLVTCKPAHRAVEPDLLIQRLDASPRERYSELAVDKETSHASQTQVRARPALPKWKGITKGNTGGDRATLTAACGLLRDPDVARSESLRAESVEHDQR